MHLAATAIVCAVRPHGEHGVIARLLTAEAGLVAGYVRGGRSRRMRPVLMPGNAVAADFRARTEDQLASLTVELTHSRAGLHGEPLPAAAIVWVTALVAAVLPESQPYPRLYAALDGMLGAIEHAPSARGWVAALVRFEALTVAELGYADGPPAPPTPEAAWPELLAALDASGTYLHRDVFADRRGHAFDARERLVTRLRRLLG